MESTIDIRGFFSVLKTAAHAHRVQAGATSAAAPGNSLGIPGGLPRNSQRIQQAVRLASRGSLLMCRRRTPVICAASSPVGVSPALSARCSAIRQSSSSKPPASTAFVLAEKECRKSGSDSRNSRISSIWTSLPWMEGRKERGPSAREKRASPYIGSAIEAIRSYVVIIDSGLPGSLLGVGRGLGRRLPSQDAPAACSPSAHMACSPY